MTPEERHEARLQAIKDDAFTCAEKVEELKEQLKLAKQNFNDLMAEHKAEKERGPEPASMFDGEGDE